MNSHKSGFIEKEVAIQKLNCGSAILEKHKQMTVLFFIVNMLDGYCNKTEDLSK